MELLDLFKENFKPCAIVPYLGLAKEFIINNGFTTKDINLLINDGKIEKHGKNGFRFTSQFMKEWTGGVNSIPEFVRDEFAI